MQRWMSSGLGCFDRKFFVFSSNQGYFFKKGSEIRLDQDSQQENAFYDPIEAIRVFELQS